MKPRRKLPPIKPPGRVRKGNHPANPYAAEAAAAPRLEDRPGYPFAARKADLSDAAQLGQKGPPPGQVLGAVAEDAEPTFTLRARDPMFGMIVRFWAEANIKALSPHGFAIVQNLAARGDAWREKNSRAGWAGRG